MSVNPHLHSNTEHKLGLVGWGLFFVWLGASILTEVPFWIVMLGIGAITLGIQGARRALSFNLEAFWVVVGLLFVLGGIWSYSGTTVPLLPVLMIVVGAGVVAGVMSGRKI